MPVHKPVNRKGIYFITFTCHSWWPLIDITNSYDLVYKWFDVLSWRAHTIVGYVIMPNHIHLLLYYCGGGQKLNTVVGNGKRFMAYGMIDRLKAKGDHGLLDRLNKAVTLTDKSKDQKHEVWEDSFEAKQCRTEKFALQKLNYMHFNPCVDRWRLADHTYHYPHSSASFYEQEKQHYPRLKDYRDFIYMED